MSKKKAELKRKQRNVFFNEDLTPLRSAILSITKELLSVKNTTTRDGRIVAWLKDAPDKPLFLETPDDLVKVGVNATDWKKV